MVNRKNSGYKHGGHNVRPQGYRSRPPRSGLNPASIIISQQESNAFLKKLHEIEQQRAIKRIEKEKKKIRSR